MYFEDLTLYSYYLSCTFNDVKNIGWLDQKHKFKVGEAPEGFCTKLNEILVGTSSFSSEVNLIRGIHPCNFCGSGQQVDPSSKIGSCEIWIPSINEGAYFASPSQIIHYVEKHNYLPPQKFIESVMELDLSSSFNGQDLYDKLIREAASNAG
jgi:hypothetical protein